MYCMRRSRGGDAFDLIPRFFLLPRDYDEFKADVERFSGRMYIQKVCVCVGGGDVERFPGRMYIQKVDGCWGGGAGQEDICFFGVSAGYRYIHLFFWSERCFLVHIF